MPYTAEAGDFRKMPGISFLKPSPPHSSYCLTPHSFQPKRMHNGFLISHMSGEQRIYFFSCLQITSAKVY
ncbi:hypothetical protein XELAEV_18010933mg [Xenopus laevis]|uniref:Uncharacterized protein n=1 Tax=Xenopus laevis TaxID=8355 RepID=A0A974I1R2_XENLA|nr:hypothetical protein XELAEV_18010933mg [Xenopus laevis]